MPSLSCDFSQTCRKIPLSPDSEIYKYITKEVNISQAAEGHVKWWKLSLQIDPVHELSHLLFHLGQVKAGIENPQKYQSSAHSEQYASAIESVIVGFMRGIYKKSSERELADELSFRIKSNFRMTTIKRAEQDTDQNINNISRAVVPALLVIRDKVNELPAHYTSAKIEEEICVNITIKELALAIFCSPSSENNCVCECTKG